MLKKLQWLVLLVLLQIAPAQAQDGYTRTVHPVVLIHGMLGFESIGPINYFHDVARGLRSSGATVYQPTTTNLGATETRGRQLIAFLESTKASTGAQKFNLIGHSHGGMVARYVGGVRPDLVASITSVGSPHTGSPVADLIMLSKLEPLILKPSVEAIFNALGTIIQFVSGNSQPVDSLEEGDSLSTVGTAAFNAAFPAGMPFDACGSGASVERGIHNFSAGGVGTLTNIVDPDSYFMASTSLVFLGQPNDGLVGQCSTHFGKVLRDDFPWNHLDESNMFFGLRAPFSPDPVAFYRSHVNRLKQLGL